MLISKSRFLNLIRCNRFVALQELDKKGSDALITLIQIQLKVFMQKKH